MIQNRHKFVLENQKMMVKTLNMQPLSLTVYNCFTENELNRNSCFYLSSHMYST